MDQHARMTFAIGRLYSNWAEQVSTFFSAPGTIDDNGNYVLNAEQPTAEQKQMHLRDAEAHKRMAQFDEAMVAIAGGDVVLPNVPES